MIYYMIRHKESGEFMPQCRKSGYSHWNPSKNKIPMNTQGVPRLIDTRRKAARCIIQWAAMPNAEMSYRETFDGGDFDIQIKDDGREIEDLEVVEVEIVIREK